jgi:hypothetical protein
VRIIAACAFAFFATSAVAENLVIDDASIQYTYSFDTRGPLHSCALATTMAKAPIVIKLTAAFITDDAKPKDNDLTVTYVVDAFFVGAADKNSKLEPKQVKVVGARIISDIFNSDLHAVRNVDKDLGASYNISSEGSIGPFTNVLTIRGIYTLAVEFEDHTNVIVNVKETPDIFSPGEKWNKCSIAIIQHQPPPP